MNKTIPELIFEKRVKGNPRRPQPLREAAQESGIHPSTLSRLERGGLPDVETLRALSVWIGMTADELLALIPTPKGK